MKVPTDPVLKIERGIARMRERIANWDTEADEVEASWTGGPEYRKFCRGMAGAARQKKEELEAELKQLQGQPNRNERKRCGRLIHLNQAAYPVWDQRPVTAMVFYHLPLKKAEGTIVLGSPLCRFRKGSAK